MSTSPSISLLVSDVDRTLLTHDYVLPEQVVEAVGRLQKKGVRIVLASARSPEALRPFAERLGLTSLAACFNGGWIGDLRSGVSLVSTTINRDEGLAAMRMATELGLNALWYGHDRVSALASNPTVEHEVRITAETLGIVDTVDALPGQPGKIMCVRTDPNDDTAFDALHEKLSGSLSLVRSHWRLLEINPPGVSKRVAIEFLSEHLGMGREACAAAGDAENDVEMLRWAHVALTVGNALDEIKAFAAFTGPSCDEGGMAAAVDWLNNRLYEPLN
ncbi:HMP-PP hydrolase (pyridoxal phosphatase) Cof [Sinorhizobium sojae CCBAU 05684]|uniref:HMP-PP hydrolase (Pyridoxal phosphatase) Cof n=1 Tax=Sinorhizobium sojae CCBAU 05684 TaxID=716928 RepID=A0A249P9H1_9HYPH|nr:HAD family hydrolase [Sinorhizobium sojae]ASY62583.1 HMP-PP hydrolase (pyridoxal phosphatase) Cof [Sinorhizobium sojae CCBAU 05684]